MKPKQLLVGDGVLSLAFGVLLLVAPGLALAILGLSIDPVRGLLAEFLGAAVTVNGVFQILLRDQGETAAGRTYMRSYVLFDILGASLGAWGIATHVVNAWAWVVVALFAAAGLAHAWWGWARPVTVG